MNKKLWVVLLPVVLLACNFLSSRLATPTPLPVPTIRYGGAENPETIQEAEGTGFTIVRIHPGDIDAQAMIASEVKKAISAGLLPVVEFDATWCPPCQAIDESLRSRNELMMNAYQGTYIIKMDVDEWGWGVGDFRVSGIPKYFKVDEDGKPTGKVIDGGAWGDNIPVNMAPPMDEFFHGG
jgi:thiol-disulfide isomerase/thioredoxin